MDLRANFGVLEIL
jgi:hypothetical protein